MLCCLERWCACDDVTRSHWLLPGPSTWRSSSRMSSVNQAPIYYWVWMGPHEPHAFSIGSVLHLRSRSLTADRKCQLTFKRARLMTIAKMDRRATSTTRSVPLHPRAVMCDCPALRKASKEEEKLRSCDARFVLFLTTHSTKSSSAETPQCHY